MTIRDILRETEAGLDGLLADTDTAWQLFDTEMEEMEETNFLIDETEEQLSARIEELEVFEEQLMGLRNTLEMLERDADSLMSEVTHWCECFHSRNVSVRICVFVCLCLCLCLCL